MVLTLSPIRKVTRFGTILERAALLIGVVAGFLSNAVAQSQGRARPENGPPPAPKSPVEKVPLSDAERAELFKLIKSLQERVEKRDFRVGANFFPVKNKVVRWNNEALYLYKSAVGYTSVPYPIGGRGWVFHSSMELAF